MTKIFKDKIIKALKKKDGFSLVEMLIVLIVVAILMAIIIPNVAGQRDRIDTQATANMADIITNQVENYRLVEGLEPGDDVTLNILETEQYITARQKEQATKLLKITGETVITTPITIPDSSTD